MRTFVRTATLALLLGLGGAACGHVNPGTSADSCSSALCDPSLGNPAGVSSYDDPAPYLSPDGTIYRNSPPSSALHAASAATPSTVPAAPARLILVGDSIGRQLSEAFTADHIYVGDNGQDPATSPWESQLRALAPTSSDTVVIEDWSIPGLCPTCGPATEGEWRAAMTSLTGYADSTGARLFVLQPHAAAPGLVMLPADVAFVGQLPGTHVELSTADNGDGLHYTPAGAAAMAARLALVVS